VELYHCANTLLVKKKGKKELMIWTKMFESEEEGEGRGVLGCGMLVKFLVFLWHFLASLFGDNSGVVLW